MPSDEEPQLVGKCPECGAPMTPRKSKKGKTYYSCSRYPDCKFMSWDIPTGEKCPECGSPLVQTARGGIKCSNKECKYRIRPEKPEKQGKPEKEGVDGEGAKPASGAHDFRPQEGPDDAPPLMEEPWF